jgi:glycosyltransferase involved in cell wall biosynthesis
MVRRNVSIVVPAKNDKYIHHLLNSLRSQTILPTEVVIVTRPQFCRPIESLASSLGVPATILKQESGFVVEALQKGKDAATGDYVVFTDDDAIPDSAWIQTYLNYFDMGGNRLGCVSSRDVYLDISSGEIFRTSDDYVRVRLYRKLVRPWLDRPHKLLKEYRNGVYVSKSFEVVCGPSIPRKKCRSLPFRGVNMCFRREALDDTKFPVNLGLRRAIGYEAVLGIQLVLNGWDSIYVPDNVVKHIIHSSLSRGLPQDKSTLEELASDRKIIRNLIKGMLVGNRG